MVRHIPRFILRASVVNHFHNADAIGFRYNVERGYGFIAVDDGGPDMYVHATGLETDRPLKDGDHVRFVTEIDRRTNKPKVRNKWQMPMVCAFSHDS